MTFMILCLIYKSPSLTFEQFKSHYETSHVLLVKSIISDPNDLPVLYKRHYIDRQAAGASQVPGQDFDAITTVTFKDLATSAKFKQIMDEPGNKEKIDADSAAFLDVTRGVVIPVETSDVI